MSPTTPPTEDEVRLLLSEALDLEARGRVPESRRPPVVDWPAVPVKRRHSWVAPVAAAAVVAGMAVAVGAVVVNRNQTTPDPNPATVSVSPTPTETPSTAATPGDTTTADPTAAPTTPAGTSVGAGGATLVVPPGYAVRADPGSGGTTPISDRWCIDTAGTTDCLVSFNRLRPDRNALNSDAAGDYDSNSQYCGPGTPSRLLDYRDTTLGGRPAEYRAWRWDCQGQPDVDVAQYSVMTPTPFDLFSDKATDQVKALMARIAEASRLPAATGSVRYYDHGIVRATRPAPSGGTTISVDRVVHEAPNNSPSTYDYLVPAGGEWDAARLAGLVGQSVTLQTDGTVLTALRMEP